MIPLRFEIVGDGFGLDQKIYISILQQFKHHYAGKTMYRVRLEGEQGWVGEHIYCEEFIRGLLKQRVE